MLLTTCLEEEQVAKEIERKYTINLDKLDMKGRRESLVIEQGYLTDKPWVRIRIVDNENAYLTIKFNTETSVVRDEYEWPIGLAEGQELLARCSGVLRKMRHIVQYKAAFKPEAEYHLAAYKNQVWVVDQFLGPLSGIWIAEIEYSNEAEKDQSGMLILPEWVGKEVTGDKRYSQTSFIVYGNPDKYPDHEHPLQIENRAKREAKVQGLA
jgi:CYTH domain-containing protein